VIPPPPPRLVPPLARSLHDDSDARHVAAALVAVCRRLDTELSRIVGPKGVAALHHRSLRLATAAHAWLGEAADGSGDSVIDLAALESVVSRQASSDAALGANDFLHTFRQLLVSLVGDSLTEQLLHPVWTDPLAGAPASKDAP
jgi:hypothetical protein